jgi:YaiO family outer membrane protein
MSCGLLVLLAVSAYGQVATVDVDKLPQVIRPSDSPLAQIAEFGLSFGRYKFKPGGDTSGYNSQFGRYTRSRPSLDAWRIDVGRQGRFDTSSLDAGLSYTRFVGPTGLTAGISGGTSDVLSNRYRLNLGVTHPIAGFQTSLGYSRTQSHGENSSDGWNLGLSRWFPHWIASASYNIEFGQPGDTQSGTMNLGLTYYVWRQTYLGGGISFGSVAYQLFGPGTPLLAPALVDYDAWTAYLALTRYLTDHSGFNARYDHSDAKNIWTIDGITASYFHEW